MAHAITWQDSRADRFVSERVDNHLRRDIYRKTGIPIDGRYLAPMFQYHYGLKHQKVNLVLSAKDFLFYSLTGLRMTDPSTASGYGLYNLRIKAWDPDLCMFWGVAAQQLPSIERSSFRAPLSKRGGQFLSCTPGIPVVLGCADSVAGAFAVSVGHSQLQTAIVLTGSSTVILKYDPEPHWDSQSRYLVTPLAVDGKYGREADLLSSGSARKWAADTFLRRGTNRRRESVWRPVYRLAPGADGLFFAPFLARGEQGILWNSRLRGTLTGLTLAHKGAKIARALVEGMCFEIRRCLEYFEDEAPLSSVRLTGWAADIPEEAQLLADVTGKPVQAFGLGSASALGAALVSGMIDWKKYLENARSLVFSPGQRSLCYNELYRNYIAQFPSAEAPSTHAIPSQTAAGRHNLE